MRTCPFCSEEIPEDANVCPVCNEKLDKEETKKCPYCNEDIPKDVKICPTCGEKLQKPVNLKLNIGIGAKLYAVIGIVLILLLGAFGYTIFKENDIKEADKIMPAHETTEPRNLRLRLSDILETTQKHDEILMNYLEAKHFTESKDTVFLAYLENIEYYTVAFSYIDTLRSRTINDSNSNLKKGKVAIAEGVTITPTLGKPKYEWLSPVVKVEITSPSVPYIKMASGEEGWFVAEPNFQYINETYSKYLSQSLKDYLAIKEKIQKDLNNQTYFMGEGVNADTKMLKEWVIAWQEFLDKYPEFSKKDAVNKSIHQYTLDFISHWRMFNYDDDDKIDKYNKAEYESFLKLAKPNSEAHRIIEKGYSILKAHNFYYNQEYAKFCEDILDAIH